MAGLVPGSRAGAENGSTVSIQRPIMSSLQPVQASPYSFPDRHPSAPLGWELCQHPLCSCQKPHLSPFHWDAELIICLHPFSQLVPMLPSGVIKRSDPGQSQIPEGQRRTCLEIPPLG